MLDEIIFLALAVAVFFVIYALVHHWLPNMGRIVATISIGAAAVLDQFSVLPWGNILDDAKTKLLGFAIAACLALLHAADAVKAGQPPSPPAGQ